MTTDRDMQEKIHAFQAYTGRAGMGTNDYHQHPLGLVFTDGIKFLADTFGAYWLVDMVANHQREVRRHHEGARRFQTWRLMAPAADGEPWVLDCWDDMPDDSTMFCRQEFDYSNFPTELAARPGGFQFWVEHGVALLKEEH